MIKTIDDLFEQVSFDKKIVWENEEETFFDPDDDEENIFDDWIEEARVAYHEHDGFPEHPVRVKNHEEYFRSKTEEPLAERQKKQIERINDHIDKVLNVSTEGGKFIRTYQRTAISDKIKNTIHSTEIPFQHLRKIKSITLEAHHPRDTQEEIKQGKMTVGGHSNGEVFLYYSHEPDIIEDVDFTFIHELGHWVHNLIAENNTPALLDIIIAFEESEEKNSGFPTEYARTNTFEYFADCYASYWTENEEFRKRNPMMAYIFDREFANPQLFKQNDLGKIKQEVIEYESQDPVGVGKFNPELSDMEQNVDEKEIGLSKQEDIKMATKAFITNDEGKVLVLKDSAEGTNRWDLPGGHVQEGETPDESLVREIFEETGLSVISFRPVFTHTLQMGNEELPVIFYKVKAQGKVYISSEHSECAWIGLDDL